MLQKLRLIIPFIFGSHVTLRVRDIGSRTVEKGIAGKLQSHPHSATSTKKLYMMHVPRTGDTIRITNEIKIIVREAEYSAHGSITVIADFASEHSVAGYEMEREGFRFWSFASRERRNKFITTTRDKLLGFPEPA